MNKIFKKIILIWLIALMFLCFKNNSYARIVPSQTFINDGGGGGDSESGSSAGSGVLERFKGTSGDLTGKSEVTTIMSSVLEVIRLAGAGIAVIILLVIGIKYAMASVGERADIKKYAINYLIGALILFGASGILSILQKVITDSISGN